MATSTVDSAASNTPRLADVDLVARELDDFDFYLEIFTSINLQQDVHQNWYKKHGQISEKDRVIAWKEGKLFSPESMRDKGFT